MMYDVFQEQIFFTTVRICIKNSKGACISIGSGFIYNKSVKDVDNRNATLLISNKHVFVDARQSLEFTLHKLNGEDDLPNLTQHHTFSIDNFSEFYYEHPDSDVDLACVNISNALNIGVKLFTKTLSEDLFCNYKTDKLLPGSDVWFVGYPQNGFDTKHNLPLMRHGYIASMPNVDFEGERSFIIDAQVFPGSSGSPVFSIINNKYKFLGVISATMIRKEKLKSIPVKDREYFEQVIGLGIVVKSDCVKELIECVPL